MDVDVVDARAIMFNIDKANLIFRYPYNLDFEYGALEGLQKFSINNLGDPFIESNYGVHSREFEVSNCLLSCKFLLSCNHMMYI